MSKKNDPTLFESRYERNAGDRYWTHPWMTRALLRHVPLVEGLEPTEVAWEPAAGRGDMARVLHDAGVRVFASDVDMNEFPEDLADALEWEVSTRDFLSTDRRPSGVEAIVTNPPYFKETHDRRYCSMAEHFVRKALELNPRYVCMLTRAEFGHAKSRRDLFHDHRFMTEIKLGDRPRWDWWFRDEPEASPRHYYSWFVWMRGNKDSPSIQIDGMQDDDRYEPVEDSLLEDLR